MCCGCSVCILIVWVMVVVWGLDRCSMFMLLVLGVVVMVMMVLGVVDMGWVVVCGGLGYFMDYIGVWVVDVGNLFCGGFFGFGCLVIFCWWVWWWWVLGCCCGVWLFIIVVVGLGCC